jgi:hypothetical protein
VVQHLRRSRYEQPEVGEVSPDLPLTTLDSDRPRHALPE